MTGPRNQGDGETLMERLEGEAAHREQHPRGGSPAGPAGVGPEAQPGEDADGDAAHGHAQDAQPQNEAARAVRKGDARIDHPTVDESLADGGEKGARQEVDRQGELGAAVRSQAGPQQPRWPLCKSNNNQFGS